MTISIIPSRRSTIGQDEQAAAKILRKGFVTSVRLGMLLYAVCMYVYLCPRLNLDFYSIALYHPEPLSFQKSAFNFEKIGMPSPRNIYFLSHDGVKLHGWLFGEPRKGGKVMLMSHGNAGNVRSCVYGIKSLLAVLDQRDALFVYDYRGFGRSEGRPSLQGLILDGVGAYDTLRQRFGVDAARIVLVGESIGSGVTCELANQKPCAGVILISSFTSLVRVARDSLPVFWIYPDCLYPDEMFDNLSRMKTVKMPLLVIQGTKDKVTSMRNAEDLLAVKTGVKQLIAVQGADHNDCKLLEDAKSKNAMKQFVDRL